MTVERAIKIIHDNAVWDSVKVSCPNLQTNIVDAIMQAVDEEREACAKEAESFAGIRLDLARHIAARIRARGAEPVTPEGGAR